MCVIPGGLNHRQQFRPRPRQPSQHYSNSQDSSGDSENPHRPWVTPQHLQLIAERNALYEKYQATRSEDDMRLFKIKRFEVNQIINDAKILFLQQNPNQRPQFHNPHASSMHHQSSSNSTGNSGMKPPKVLEERSYENRGAFHCDPCERKFPTQAVLDEHLSEHITCK